MSCGPPLSFLDFQAKGQQGFPFYNYFPEKGHAGADWGGCGVFSGAGGLR